MLELIRRVGREFGISIVISTHLMGDVERACDSVVVLDAGRLLRTGAVSGFTEETETLEVELVEGAAARRGRCSRARGLERAARRQPPDARPRLRRRLRHAPRRDRRVGRAALPARAGAALARRRLRDRSRREPARGGRRGVTTGPAEIFDLGYQGYEGERTSRWSRRRAIWRDGIRISLGLGRGAGAKIAPWLLHRRSRSCRWSSSSCSRRSSAPARRSGRLRAALVRRVLRVGDRAARALRGGRRAAPALPRPPRRRARALRGAADHAARLRRLALGGVPHGRARSPPGCRRRSSSPGTRSTPRDPGRGSPTTGTSCRGSSPRASLVAVVLTTLALFVASFATRRAYAAVAMLAVLFVGSAIGGIAEENFSGGARRRALPGERPAGVRRHRALDLRRRGRPSAPGVGVSALWLVGADDRARRAGSCDGRDGWCASERRRAQPTIVVDGVSQWFAGVVAVSDVSLVGRARA